MTIRAYLRRAALALVLLALAGPAGAAEKITMGLVGGTPSFYWPCVIGIAQGFFAAEGVEVDPVYVASSGAITQELAAGSLDIGSPGMVDPIRAIAKGAGLAVLRIEAVVAPFTLYASPSIHRIEDLKGKIVMVGGSKDITLIYVERMLAAHGVKPGEFDTLYAGMSSARFAALQSGAAQAAIVGSPFDARAAAAGDTNLGLVMEYVKDLPFTGYVANRKWTDAHQDAARRFLAGYQKAVDWFYVEANRAAAVKVVTDITHSDPADTVTTYDFFHKIGFFDRSAKVSAASLQGLVSVLQQFGDVDRPIPADAMIMRGVTMTD